MSDARTVLERAVVVLDVGKTISKVSLWDRTGKFIAGDKRPNQAVTSAGRRVLDTAGIENWLASSLRRFAPMADIGHVIPVGHGAAVAIVHEGKLLFPPVDYEEPVDAATRVAYNHKRDAFGLTGSPALPDGLNLGVQLFGFNDALTKGTQILLWPQYWAWLLCGVAASEVTSLGCHTDLWYPREGCFSNLTLAMGWTEHFPPLRHAGDALGTITEEWATRTGLPRDTQIHCGIHDSNAALQAARQFPEIRGHEATILSTGTWFVAMRTPAAGESIPALAENRDCLLNVDIHGRPIPSARFMGGREIEILAPTPDDLQTVVALPRVIESRAMILPAFVAGVGPFPRNRGCWRNKPSDDATQQAAAHLYAAMVANASLDLIGAKERILVEGRFAQTEGFLKALATLRPNDLVFTTDGSADVSFGAMCLLNAGVPPASPLRRVEAVSLDLSEYLAAWNAEVLRNSEQ